MEVSGKIRYAYSSAHEPMSSLSGVALRDRITSEKIRKQWKVEKIIDDIQNYQQKWNQHVLRMPKNRIPRNALQYRPQEIRDLGRYIGLGFQGRHAYLNVYFSGLKTVFY